MNSRIPQVPPGVNLDFQTVKSHVRRHAFLYGVCLAAPVAYLVFSTARATPIYASEASVLMANTESAGDIGLLFMRDTSNPVYVLEGVLKSHSSRKMMAEKTGIQPQKIQERLIVLPNVQTKQILIQAKKGSTEDNEKLVIAAIEVLRERAEIYKGLAGDQAKEMASALEARETELEEAEQELADFTKSMKTSPDAASYLTQLRQLELDYGAAERQLVEAQERATTSARAAANLPTSIPQAETWRQKLIDKRLEVETLKQSRGPMDPQLVRLQRELKVIEDTVKKETAAYVQSISRNIDSATAELATRKLVLGWQVETARALANLAPEEAMTYQRLTREVGTLSTVVTTMRTQYETARYQSDVQKMNWAILDEPHRKDKPENKSFPMAILKGLLAGGVLAVVAGFLKDKLFGRK